MPETELRCRVYYHSDFREYVYFLGVVTVRVYIPKLKSFSFFVCYWILHNYEGNCVTKIRLDTLYPAINLIFQFEY